MTRKVWIFALPMLLCLEVAGCEGAGQAPPRAAAAADSAPTLNAGEEAALEEAMDRFVAALMESDTDAFATLFPRHGLWTFESTIGDASARSVHSLTELRRDLADRSGLYESFFGGEGDSIRDFADSTGGRPWQRLSDQRFSPPDRPDMRELMFIRWRREDGRWVVDRVAAPFA